MKKIILGMVFVFATVTMVNANSKVEDKVERVDCIELAFKVDNDMGGISYEEFSSIVNNCESMQR